MQLKPKPTIAMAALVLLSATPTPALAYMGPGLGFGAFGTALGVVGALLLGLISVLWYPLKRLYRRLRGITAAPHASRPRSAVKSGDKRP